MAFHLNFGLLLHLSHPSQEDSFMQGEDEGPAARIAVNAGHIARDWCLTRIMELRWLAGGCVAKVKLMLAKEYW